MTRAISKIKVELTEGMNLSKCRKCGRMRDLLILLDSSLIGERLDALGLASEIKNWISLIEDIEYAQLDCERCHPASVMIILREELPQIDVE